MSEQTTRGVKVHVTTAYIEERSEPDEDTYFFAYRVRITNLGEDAVTLMRRRWVITDGSGESQTVKGAGVVGKQPRLEPGQSFEYTSFCPMGTPVGVMEGAYEMITEDEERFDALIAPFTLAMPNAIH